MIKIIKKAYYSVITAIIFVFIFGTSALANNINITIDDRLVSFPDQKPYIDNNNRTLVPVRFVSEELGGEVDWDAKNKLVTLSFVDETIRIKLNSNRVVSFAGGIETILEMDTVAVLNNGRVMVPLGFISEVLGSKVIWDGKTSTVKIESPIRNMPDRELIMKYSHLDSDILSRLEKKDSYSVIKKWPTGNTLTSSGEFKDLVEKIDRFNVGDYFYFEYGAGGLDDVWWISLYLSTDLYHNNYFYYDLTRDALEGNNKVIINKKDFKVGAGNPTWGNVNYFRIAFQSKDSKTVTIWPEIFATYKVTPLCTLWFDDGWEDTYTNAFRIISSINPSIPGQVALVPKFVGSDRYLNLSQIMNLVKAGWEISNHTYSHVYLTELSNAEIEREILRAYSYISAIDPKGAYHLAVPYSSFDDRVLRIVQEYTLSARYVPEQLNPIPFDRHGLAFMEVTNQTDFATVKGWIDEAIEKKLWINLMFHRIDDPADNRYTYSTAPFARIIEYLHSRRDQIKTVTYTQALEMAGYTCTPVN